MVKIEPENFRRDPDIALDCYLRWLQGETKADIGRRYDWKLQPDSYGCMRFCRTADRYVDYGKRLFEKRQKLREAAFPGLKSVEPRRVKRPRGRNLQCD